MSRLRLRGDVVALLSGEGNVVVDFRGRKSRYLSVTLRPQLRNELRSYAVELTAAEVARTGDQNAHIGPCGAARIVLERWMAVRVKRREETSAAAAPNASPQASGDASRGSER